MKKLFTFALALMSMSAMAEVETLLTYTVGATQPAEKTPTEAGEGTIFMGTTLAINDTDIPGSYGWKLDGDIDPDHTLKYVRLDIQDHLAVGDVIYVSGWSASGATAENPQGFALYDNYKGDTICVHYGDAVSTTSSKKTLFEAKYVIAEGSDMIGKKRVYICRLAGKSVFFNGARIVRGEEGPEPTVKDTITLPGDTLVLTQDMTFTPNKELVFVAPHISMTLSADTFKVSADTTEVFGPEGFYAITAGKVNPGPKNSPTPNVGAFYTFEATCSGHLYVPAKMGANKKIDVSNGAFMPYYIGSTLHQSQTPASTTEQTLDFINFDVVAGTTYYVFGEGTKLGIYGFRFVPDVTPVVEMKSNVESVKCIVNGRLVIKRGNKTYDVHGKAL